MNYYFNLAVVLFTYVYSEVSRSTLAQRQMILRKSEKKITTTTVANLWKKVKEFKKTNLLLHIYLDQFRELLTRQGLFKLHRYNYRGSTYEGVKVYNDVDDPDLEFYVMFIVQGGSKLSAVSTGNPGYVNLKPTPAFKDHYPTLFRKSAGESTGYQSAKKMRETFSSQVKRAIQILQKLGSEEQHEISLDMSWHLREHVPAIHIDVICRGPCGKKLFSIDLVPQLSSEIVVTYRRSTFQNSPQTMNL